MVFQWIMLCTFLLPQTSTAAQPTATDILRTTLAAIEKVVTIEYEVRRESTADDNQKFKSRTTILAARNPLRFRARLQGEDLPVVELAIGDGKTTKASTAGKVSESSTFAQSNPSAMIVANNANTDVAATGRVLLDTEHLKTAIASGNLLLLGQSEIEDDLCHLVLYGRNMMNEYYWISTKTGLPRAVQRVNIAGGQTLLSSRFVITNIRLNPTIPADAFTYQPTASDSSAPPAAAPAAAATASAVGRPLPELEVRDVEYKPLKLTDFKGKPTIFNFWATWCGPCIKELPAFQRLLIRYKGKLQVVAIAVQDVRQDALKFVQQHPEYKFVFVTDPDMQESESRLQKHFGVQGIPVSVFVNAEGKVLEQWFGFKNEQELVQKIQRLMRQ